MDNPEGSFTSAAAEAACLPPVETGPALAAPALAAPALAAPAVWAEGGEDVEACPQDLLAIYVLSKNQHPKWGKQHPLKEISI